MVFLSNAFIGMSIPQHDSKQYSQNNYGTLQTSLKEKKTQLKYLKKNSMFLLINMPLNKQVYKMQSLERGNYRKFW